MAQRSQQADRVLDLARTEAEWFGHRYLGPEHLVLGMLLREPPLLISQALYHAAAGPLLEALRVDLDQLRDAVTGQLGGVQR